MSDGRPPGNPYDSTDKQPYGGTPQEQGQGKGMAITALILGVLSLLTFWTIVGGILLGLAGLILGLVASSRAKKGKAGGRGLAIGGWVTGLLGLVVTIAVLVFASVFFAQIFDRESFNELQTCLEQANGDSAAEQVCQQQFEDDVEENIGG